MEIFCSNINQWKIKISIPIKNINLKIKTKEKFQKLKKTITEILKFTGEIQKQI